MFVGFGEETTEVHMPFLSCHIKTACFVPGDANLEHLAEGHLSGFSTPILPYWPLWEEVTGHSPHFRSRELQSTPLRSECLHK